jgi:hypothetical protein
MVLLIQARWKQIWGWRRIHACTFEKETLCDGKPCKSSCAIRMMPALSWVTEHADAAPLIQALHTCPSLEAVYIPLQCIRDHRQTSNSRGGETRTVGDMSVKRSTRGSKHMSGEVRAVIWRPDEDCSPPTGERKRQHLPRRSSAGSDSQHFCPLL